MGTRCFLADDLERRAADDPELVFVTWMCAYAGDIVAGRRPGPYTDADARRYARRVLIPDELLERPPVDVGRASAALGVPVDEVLVAMAERSGAA